MRIGIIALLHESNTFARDRTTLENFQRDLYLVGDSIRDELADSHHEIGGFFAGLSECGGTSVDAVPLVALRATPSGVITDETFEALVRVIMAQVRSTDRLDGILVAAHGAAVSERFPDADGEWLSRLRSATGADVPIVATLDAHANLSPQIVDSCDAIIAYRTNPHLDQRDRGIEAARLIVATIRQEIQPTMAAAYPPLVINIERQCTTEPHLAPIYEQADAQLRDPIVLSNSLLLGFPYADVAELGAATIAITDGDLPRAQAMADQLAGVLWDSREAMQGQLVGLDDALDTSTRLREQRICLLDMGDNIGGGSAGDGTTLVNGLMQRGIAASFACLSDPQSVAACEGRRVGDRLSISVGGKTDDQHGSPIEMDVEVLALHDGRFTEDQPRHGGIVEFDQGRTAIVRSTLTDLTLMLTSRRVAPFSLRQITSFGLDPRRFRIVVAKGVNAPLAAYRDAYDTFIRVNTIGSTCADLRQLVFEQRRKPLFPFEADTAWPAE